MRRAFVAGRVGSRPARGALASFESLKVCHSCRLLLVQGFGAADLEGCNELPLLAQAQCRARDHGEVERCVELLLGLLLDLAVQHLSDRWHAGRVTAPHTLSGERGRIESLWAVSLPHYIPHIS